MSINPKSWADAFTAELTVAGQHVPLDRVVARHSEAFAELRSLGMTWRGIAALLIRAGARRADDGLISSDQLRVSYARCARRDSSPPPRPKLRTSPPPRTTTDSPPLAVASPQEHQSPASDPEQQPSSDKDVSGSEVEAALARRCKLGINGVKK